jgi:DnaJ-class molecular chaperone
MTDPEVECEHCKGAGGFDASKDPEVYDDWRVCPYCEGSGKAKYDELFDPKRDAWRAND